MRDTERWEAVVDDAVHEINMRWGEPLDDSDQPDTDVLPQEMVRETAEAILRPVEAENVRLRAALGEIVLHADMPAGESWEQAYVEVTTMAREALRHGEVEPCPPV